MEISQDTMVMLNLGTLAIVVGAAFGVGVQWARNETMRRDLNNAWRAIREHEGYWKEIWKKQYSKD